MKEKFPGIFEIDGKIYTKSHKKGFKHFGEVVIKKGKDEYRSWDPTRSKAAAAIVKGVIVFPLKEGNKVLYLGAAHGFTPSFLANVVGEKGIIYAVEFSDRCFRELLPLCDEFDNISPMLADARKPELYSWIEKVDTVYVDIAQPDQTEIAIRNCKDFLKPKGYLMLAVKTQSIDITKSSKEVTKAEIEKLEKAGFKILDWKMLDPFEAKHSFIVAQI